MDLKYSKIFSTKHHIRSTYTAEQRSFSGASTSLGSQQNYPRCLEPESSLPYSQKPFTRPCFQPHKASPLPSKICIFRQTLILSKYIFQYDRESAVGIVIRSVVQIPVRARFSTPVQTGSRTHPASRTKEAGSFQWGELPRRGVEKLSLSIAEVKYG
jgi:hypothetical protein